LVGVVVTCLTTSRKVETSHLPLHILNHFPALNVSGHHEITALLLYICYCILHENQNKEIRLCTIGNIISLILTLLKKSKSKVSIYLKYELHGKIKRSGSMISSLKREQYVPEE